MPSCRRLTQSSRPPRSTKSSSECSTATPSWQGAEKQRLACPVGFIQSPCECLAQSTRRSLLQPNCRILCLSALRPALCALKLKCLSLAWFRLHRSSCL